MIKMFRKALLVGCICTMVFAPVAFSPALAQTLGEQANEAVDEVTQAIKKELLDKRLQNFAGNMYWEWMGGDSELTRYLLNTTLIKPEDFNRFLTDDKYANEHIFRLGVFISNYNEYIRIDRNNMNYDDEKTIDVFWLYIRTLYPMGAPFLPGLAS